MTDEQQRIEELKLSHSRVSEARQRHVNEGNVSFAIACDRILEIIEDELEQAESASE